MDYDLRESLMGRRGTAGTALRGGLASFRRICPTTCPERVLRSEPAGNAFDSTALISPLNSTLTSLRRLLMTRDALASLLDRHGVQPSAQRLAVAEYVLDTDAHPSADKVFTTVRSRIPMISRATVYNTLNLLVRKRLLRQLVLAEGKVVFDPHMEPHHHFVDEVTGEIRDIPWEALEVRKIEALKGVKVHEYQVVLRGTSSTRGR